MHRSIIFIALFAAIFSKNQVVFITGGASGLGAAAVEKFAENGAQVGFLDINATEGKAFEKRFPKNTVLFIEGDVTNVSDIQNGLKKTANAFGHIDTVFASAGNGTPVPLEDISVANFDREINISYRGSIFTLKEAIPYLEKNNGGSVILIGTPAKSVSLSSISRFGIDTFTQLAAKELGPKNIRVNAIHPVAHTPQTEKRAQYFASKSGKSHQEVFETYQKARPLGRLGSAEEVAELVYYLSQEKASYITGTIVEITGGSHIK